MRPPKGAARPHVRPLIDQTKTRLSFSDMIQIIRACLIIILVSRLTICLGQGQIPDYDTPPEKVTEFKTSALKGDPVAMYKLAWLTTLGWAGVTEDKVKARELFLKSAEQGYSEAQITLADLSISGELNGKYDLPNALSWYTKAAEQGSQSAYFKLGCLSLEGNDMFEFFMQLEKPRCSLVKITQDKRIAGEYWRKAGLSKSKVEDLLSLHERTSKGDWKPIVRCQRF